MASLVRTSRFIKDVNKVYSVRLDVKLLKALNQIELFPNSGSSDIPQSIKAKYGPRIQKVALKPFDLIYLYEEEADIVILLALIHMRHAK